MKLDKLPYDELPREKALLKGVETLSNAELLAILLRSGTKEKNVIELSYEVLQQAGSFSSLANKTYSELSQIKGLKQAKALTILATMEIAKRTNYTYEKLNEADSPDKIYELFEPMLRNELQENCIVILLNVKRKIISYKKLFIGSLNSHLIHPRDIYREAIKNNAAGIILIHNHPSGDPTPSEEDIYTTLQIKELGEDLGIKLVDHIIIGKGNFYSLKSKKII